MTSWMRRETLECAEVAARFLQQVAPACLREGAALAAGAWTHVDVLGRGSSSHAGTVLRYALASHTPFTVSAALPSTGRDADVSVGSVASTIAQRVLLVAISQSGKSPDLIAYAQARRQSGARVVALVNAPGSPLGQASDLEVGLAAGPENSVAATKSTVAACLAGLGLVAGHAQARGDGQLWAALQSLPQRMVAAQAMDWSQLSALLPGARAIYLVGRGATLGVAKELALKISETTGIPALAYSSAEFLHGPLGATGAQTPVVGLCSDPDHRDSVAQALARAGARGAPCLAAYSGGGGSSGGELPQPPATERFTDALLMLPPAYLAIEAAAVQMGRNPDAPDGLAKVTRTL